MELKKKKEKDETVRESHRVGRTVKIVSDEL
jgi:hypothetical protein